jgi:hypothetical protein
MVKKRGMDVAMSASADVVVTDGGVGAFYEAMERK